MSIGLLFWILMIFAAVFNVWSAWPNQKLAGGSLLLFVVIALLGWKVFGPAVHG